MLYDPDTLLSSAEQILAAGRELYRRGWTPATSGNLSVRMDDNACAMTVSGSHTGELALEDVMAVDLDGRPLGRGVPSAEALLHTRLYTRDRQIGAVLHTHSTMATILTLQWPESVVSVTGYELQKAFRGVDSHERQLVFPVFENTQNIRVLADSVDRWMDARGTGHAYLIRGHGLYTWGSDMPECLRHIEALEFLLECEWRTFSARTAGRG